MAERRMFSKRIIESAKFLKMPPTARLLYYDLGMRADDDGIVEAYTTINMIGATEDDLKILVAKNFVNVLNEDLVTYITDWTENNKIRADRKIDSRYKDLLLQVLPETELLQAKMRADVRKKKEMDNQWTSIGQPMDNQWTAQGSIGKDSIGKDRVVEVSNATPTTTAVKNIYSYIQDNLGVMNERIMNEVDMFLEEMNEDCVKHAIDSSTDMNKRNWAYTRSILNRYKSEGIKTLADIFAEEDKRKAKVQEPVVELDYFGRPIQK